jgi:alpha-L-fucosidase 2
LTGLRHGVHDTRPAGCWQDAFVAGNGRHGAIVHGGTRLETVVVTHHCLLLPNGTSWLVPPPLAGQFDQTRDLLLAGKSADALSEFCDGWPENTPQSFHPAFAIRLRMAGCAGPVMGYRRELDYRAGIVSATWTDATGRWRRQCFVPRLRDIVVQWLEVPPAAELDLLVEHDIGLDGAPPGLRAAWQASLRPDGAVLGVAADYPDPDPLAGQAGDGYLGTTRIVASGGTVAAEGQSVRVRGAAEVLLLTRVTRRSAAASADGVARAQAEALAAIPADPARLAAEHAASHQAAFGNVSLDLCAPQSDRELPVGELLARQAASPDVPLTALLEELFDSGRYLLLAASGLLPPRLPGLWQGDWDAAWSGAITVNANLNLQLAGAVSAHVPEAVHALADMIARHLDDWRANARLLYGTRGVVAPAHTDGSSGLNRHFAPGYPHHMWTAGADWLLVPLLDYFDATGDDAFLRVSVLPVLVEVARFYADFLTRTDDRGNVVFVPSYSPENQPGGWTAAAVNSTMDIAAARHALGAAVRGAGRGDDASAGAGVSKAAGPAAAESDQWRDLLGRLPGYRINGDGALAEWAWPPAGLPLADNYDHRHVSHLYPVWPLHEITVDDTPGLAAAAARALAQRGTENGAAHGYLHQALAAARLRLADLAGRRLADVTGGDFFFRSLMSSHYPARSVYNADAACGLPGLLLELLVDSMPPQDDRPGRVELLPAVPGFLAVGRLHGARTLTRVSVDLRWDLRAHTACAAFCSQADQRIDLTCRTAAALRPEAGVVAEELRAGCWRLPLAAGVPLIVHLDLEAAC